MHCQILCDMQGSWRGSEALWIVMEYCGGGSVADLMHASDVPLDQDMIAYICAETLAGLAYLHSIGKARPRCCVMHKYCNVLAVLCTSSKASSSGYSSLSLFLGTAYDQICLS